MSKTPLRVPARPEGQAKAAEVVVQGDLAERTLEKLRTTFGAEDIDNGEALAILREAFKEAHCDHTLYNVHWWDLGAQARILADGSYSIPSPELPPVGTVLTYNNQTYYIASHRATE